MQRKKLRKRDEQRSTLKLHSTLESPSRPPKWREKGYFKKGQLVKRRRTRKETREFADKKWGCGIVTKEVCKKNNEWLYVEVYWQGLKSKTVELKKDIILAFVEVENVVLPSRQLHST